MHNPGPWQHGPPASGLSASADEVTCQQFVELVTDYFEGALAPRTLNHVEEHLVMCDWCQAYVDQMQATVASLHVFKQPLSADPPDSLLAALRAKKPAQE